MKHKDVILDFTSLLDVILIILFFFVLYSTFDAEKQIEAKSAEYEAQYEQKLEKLKDDEELLIEERNNIQKREEELKEEWSLLETVNENAVKNQQALLAFDQGTMLSFSLQKKDDQEEWQLSALRKNPLTKDDETIGTILSGEYDDLPDEIYSIIKQAGFNENEVLIITFVYDGSVIGTHRLYLDITEAFRVIQESRKNVYLNTINTSR
ncbi:MAG: biopolymer transporter ExbD [Clostridia bacterium]|nr:biopolymer transporter ExbD [Clostridia bacterium]